MVVRNIVMLILVGVSAVIIIWACIILRKRDHKTHVRVKTNFDYIQKKRFLDVAKYLTKYIYYGEAEHFEVKREELVAVIEWLKKDYDERYVKMETDEPDETDEIIY